MTEKWNGRKLRLQLHDCGEHFARTPEEISQRRLRKLDFSLPH